jgi:peptide/nickel transport system substrate-binding protein
LEVKRKPVWLVVALVLALALSTAVAAGAGAASAKKSKASGCNASRVGGTINFGQFSIGTSLDPAFRQSGGAGGLSIMTGVYDELMRSDPKTGEVTPYLAQSLTHNADYTNWVLKLRPGIKFGDGNAFDATAVAGALNRYLGPGSTFAAYSQYFTSIVATDPQTVTFTMSTPWAELATQLSTTFGMIADPAAVAKYGAAFGSTPNAGAGAGPYEVTTFSPPTSVVMKAKQNYWQGPVCVDTVNSTSVTGSQQALDSFVTGQYDISYIRDPIVYQKYINTSKVGYDHPLLTVGASDIWVNTTATAAHLDDVRVRQAIQYANDPNTISQRAYSGTLIAHSSIVPKELGIVAATKSPTYDPKKATQLLNTVKSETGWDGSIRLLCSNGGSTDFGIALAALLNNVGFKVNLDTSLPVTPFTLKVGVNHDFDIACGGFQMQGGDYFDASFVRIGPSPNSYTQWNNADYNAALKELLGQPIGTPGYDKALAKIQAIVTDQVPHLTVGSFYEDQLMQNKVQGVDFTAKNVMLWGKVYLAKA